MVVCFKGAHFPADIMLTGVRWSVAYPLSTRQVEELMQERGVSVDHATVNRWIIKYSPQLEAAFHRRKRPVWLSWRPPILMSDAGSSPSTGSPGALRTWGIGCISNPWQYPWCKKFSRHPTSLPNHLAR